MTGELVDPGPGPPDSAQLVSDLAERVPEVRHVLVVSADGVPLAASRDTPAGHLGQLAAITSSLISLAAGTARILDNGGVTQAVVVMEQGTFVIMTVDAGASLAVLTTAAADLDQVAYEMTMLVDRSAAVLTSPARGMAADDDSGGRS
ncbi:MAG: roadblock/LC7 domain-containing protein [Streptosporangiaceae bacterium]